MANGPGGASAPGGSPVQRSGGSSPDPIKRAAKQRVMGRYTTDSKGQRTYHSPEETTTYGPRGVRDPRPRGLTAGEFRLKRGL